MVKITIENDTTSLELEGEGLPVSMEACFALKGAVNALRELGKDDKFIRAAFEVALMYTE